MKRKKKIPFKYKVRRFIFFLIIILILYFIFIIIYNVFFNKNDIDDVVVIPFFNDNIFPESLEFEITDDSESDGDIIDTMFMKGFSEEEFKKILNLNPKIIKKSDEYTRIDYNFENKLHYSDLESIYMNLSNSNIVNTYIIGSSVDNRNIYGIEVGTGEKVLYIDANVHAAEVASTLILTRFLSELVNNYENDDDYTIDLLNNFKIAVIPCMNPDGYEVYNYGIESLNNKDLWIYENKDKINLNNIKFNANGVDLNRNFPTQNVGLYYKGNKLISNTSITKTTQSGKYFNGFEAGSEPETKAAMYFMIKHYKNVFAYINMHSQGRVIYAGKPNLSKEFNQLTKKFGKYVSNYTGYTVHGLSSEEVGEGNDGSVTDFMAELANGFTFSSQTGRLCSDKYINNSSKMVYNYPVITMETMKVWSSNPSYFKSEYYDNGLRELFYSLLEGKFK